MLQKTSDVPRRRWGPLAVDDGPEVESDKVALTDIAAEGDWVGDVLSEDLSDNVGAGVWSRSVEPVVGDSLGDMGPATVTVGLGTEEGGDGGEVGWAAVGWHELVQEGRGAVEQKRGGDEGELAVLGCDFRRSAQ